MRTIELLRIYRPVSIMRPPSIAMAFGVPHGRPRRAAVAGLEFVILMLAQGCLRRGYCVKLSGTRSGAAEACGDPYIKNVWTTKNASY
jgi:hypothetical protein